MRKIFKDAKDYKTMTKKISEEQLARIENKIGFDVLPGQREIYQYFEMTGSGGETIGNIIAVSQKGQYGAVEFVFGIDNSNIIKEIYIQRARERDNTFKKREFLGLFPGKGLDDIDLIGKLYKGKKTPGTTAVIRGIKKALAAFDVLVVKNK